MKELFKHEADHLTAQQAQDELYNAHINELEQKIHELKKQVSRIRSISKRQRQFSQAQLLRTL